MSRSNRRARRDPGTGLRQQYLLLKELLAASTFANEAQRGIEQIPARVLPPKALIIAISPLLDDRMIGLLADLRARGFDLVVLEVATVVEVRAGSGTAGDVASRLWSFRRDARRSGMREIGIPVAEWSHGKPLAVAVEEVAAWPRGARRVG